MKIRLVLKHALVVSLLAAGRLRAQQPVPPMVNYQGRLIDGTNLYNGPATVVFRVYANQDPGGIAVLDMTSAVTVVDGLYSTAISPPDTDTAWSWLGTEVEGGWWLQVSINGQALEPMERFLSVPYALMAKQVPLASIGAAQLADGAVTSNKLDNKSVTAAALQSSAVTSTKIASDAVTSSKIQDGTITAADVTPNTFWRTDGNSGLSSSAFIGSTDGPLFTVRCMNERVFQANLPYTDIGAEITLGHSNVIAGGAPGAVIGGGFQNRIEGNNYYATLGGGLGNVIERDAQGVALSGGEYNRIGTNAFGSTLSGGFENRIGAYAAYNTLGGGRNNEALGTNNVVGGGRSNAVAAAFSVIAGGRDNRVQSSDSVIGGGWGNAINNNAVGGVIVGGSDNRMGAAQSFIGGGTGHRALGLANVIVGGLENKTHDQFSLVVGGDNNIARGGNGYATIVGGTFNLATGSYAVVAGGYNNRADREGFVGGGSLNKIRGNSPNSVIAGGEENEIGTHASHGAIGGGLKNAIGGNGSVIAGGVSNMISADSAAIGGGLRNICWGQYDVVAGGRNNIVEHNHSAIGGGSNNYIQAECGTIPGGAANCVQGDYGFAAGRRAFANHQGAFVWADSTDENFESTLPDQFSIRATNGVRLIGSTNLGSVMVAPLHSGDNHDAQVYLSEGENGGYGIFLKYDGLANQLQVLGKNASTLYGPHLVIARDASRVGVGRTPAANALEVEGNASKTTAGEWLANSDASIKTGVRTITNAVETLGRLRPVRFRYTEEFKGRHPSIEDRDYCNYIAQEYRAVFPESVVEDGEGLLMIDTYNTQPYLVRAVQELNGQLQALRQENESLRQRLDALEAAPR